MSQKYKIAIIEDDSAISGMYKFKLLGSGYDVEVANNGELGLQLIESFQPDVVLLDLMMPVMNGLDVLAKLKKDSSPFKFKLIVLSNMGDSETLAQIKDYAVDDHIIKAELTPKQVEERIKKLLP